MSRALKAEGGREGAKRQAVEGPSPPPPPRPPPPPPPPPPPSGLGRGPTHLFRDEPSTPFTTAARQVRQKRSVQDSTIGSCKIFWLWACEDIGKRLGGQPSPRRPWHALTRTDTPWHALTRPDMP